MSNRTKIKEVLAMSDGNQDQRPEWELAKYRVQQANPSSFDWADMETDGWWYISLPHLGDAETQKEAWLSADRNTAASDVVKPDPSLLRDAVEALREARVYIHGGGNGLALNAQIKVILARFDALSAPKGDSH